jgi:hypothetical protein
MSFFSSDELRQFEADGYVVARSVVPPGAIASIEAAVWSEVGYWPDGTGRWPAHLVHIWKSYSGEPYASAWSQRAYAAVDDLVRLYRCHRPKWLGYWPILFPQPAGEPEIVLQQFHLDGHHVRRRVDSPELALIALFSFSAAGPGRGGTVVRAGSHRDVARQLAAAGQEGADSVAVTRSCVAREREVRQLTCEPGDVVFMHPFLLHRMGPHFGDAPRIACNARVSLKEPMHISPANARPSAVEQAIISAVYGTADLT